MLDKEEYQIIEMHFEELKSSKNLPSPTGVALEIIRLTQDSSIDLEDLSRPIHSDPVLSGRLLKIANSAVNGSMPKVLSIRDALLRVGTKALADLALSLSILDNNRLGICIAFDYDAFWRTSLLRGIAMQQITAQRLSDGKNSLLKPEEAFSVGLLSEIGRLALAQIHPQLYAECLKQQRGNLLALEREIDRKSVV